MIGPSALSFPWASYLPGSTVVTALRRDRALAIGFMCLSLGAILPLCVTAMLPFPDLPPNTANAAMLVKAALRDANALRYYRVNWLPFPYWTTYLFVGTMNLFVGPFVASKLLVGLLVVGWPLALMRLLLALGREPRLSLWGFLLSWDHNLQAGWHAYAAGMALSFVIVARMLEATDNRDAIRVSMWCAILALTHPMPLFFVALSGLLVSFGHKDAWQRLKLCAIAFSGALLVFIPALIARVGSNGAPGTGARYSMMYPEVSEKVTRFFEFSLDVLRGTGSETVASLSFALLLLGPLIFACLPSAERDARRWSGAMVALSLLILYAAMPMQIDGPIAHWYTYPRYASYLLASLLLVPPIAELPFWALAPGVALAMASNVTTIAAFRSFGQRSRPFLDMVDSVPGGARLLPLEYVDGDDATRMAALAHVHSYIAAKGVYDPHLFDNPSTPIQYRSDLAIPGIAWSGPRDFSLARYAPHYDFILVQGLKDDPFVREPAAGVYRVHLEKEAGMWRLYRVERP
jgi:hypothetical protein